MRDGFFDPAKRAAAKQAARDRDDTDLREGRVSREHLQHRNGFIPGDVARSARILDWKEFE
jgi:hypothetical protein